MTRFLDLTGKRFGQLTVIKRLEPQRGRTVKWICVCDCGLETIVQRSNLQSGATTSCGQHRYQNLQDKNFGRLTCLELGKGYKNKNGSLITWICLCECGNKTDVLARQLISGKTRSCGCLRKKITKERFFTGYKDISGKYWSSVSGGARKRLLEFNITKEFIWNLYEKQGRKCALSGVDIIFCLEQTKSTASIDRINNNNGYTVDNVQLLHKTVNIMKNNLNQKDFIEFCKNIADRN